MDKDALLNSPFGIAEYKLIKDKKGKDADLVLKGVNRKFEEIAGMTEQEMVGKPASSLSQDHPLNLFLTLGSLKAMEYSGQFTYHYRIKEQQKDYRVTCYDGGNSSMITVFSDNTECYNSLEKARNNERLFRKILDEQTSFVVRFDPDGTITFLNKALKEFLGRQVKTQRIWKVKDNIYEAKNLFTRKDTERLGREMPELTLYKNFPVKDENIVYQKWVVSAIFGKGNQVTELQAIGTDITFETIFSTAIADITTRISKVTGDLFFQTLVKNIYKLLNVEMVILAEFDKEHDHVLKPFAYCRMGKMTDCQDINLVPEELVDVISTDFTLIHQHGGDEEDRDIILFDDMIINTLISAPLRDQRNRLMGVLLLMSQRTRTVSEPYVELIKVFALRASAEKERIEAETVIKESENKYRILADYNYDLEYWIGNEGKYIYISPSCYRITGYRPEEFLKDPELLDKITLPEFQRDLEEQAPNALTAEEFHNSIEIRIRHKSGEERWINRTCNLLYDDEGQYWGIRGNIRDITDKKQMELVLGSSEKKFRNIFNNSQEGMVIADNDHLIHEVNNSFREMTDLSGKDLAGRKLEQVINSPDLKTFLVWKKKLNESGSSIELRLETCEGKRTMEVTGKRISYLDGQANLIIMRDITERKSMEAKILNAIIDTEEKERMRIAQDLHDGLGPLLSTIKLYANSVLKARDEDVRISAAKHTVETVDEAITNLKGISNNLSPHILRNFGLVAAVESFIQKFTDTSNLRVDVASNSEERFNSNVEVTVFRILIELLNNTYKHAGADHVEIRLDHTADVLEINYKDNGRGMDYGKVMASYKGNGLLNIINRIRSINGDIFFNTAPGKGFRVNIIVTGLYA